MHHQLEAPAVIAKSADNAPALAPSSPSASDNHIYYNQRVDSDSCIALTKQIRELVNGMRQQRITQGLHDGWPKTPIWLHVQSWGGNPFPALAVADQLELFDWPVYSIVEGYCASAATFIALACEKRFILPSSFMLIHQLSSLMWGTFEQFQDEINLQAMLMEQFTAFYARHSNVKPKEIRKRLKRDYWMSAQQAVSDGFVDKLLPISL